MPSVGSFAPEVLRTFQLRTCMLVVLALASWGADSTVQAQQAAISWIGPNQLTYKVVDCGNPTAVGLQTTFRRLDQ